MTRLTLLPSRTAFILGLSLALLPAIGPFVAVAMLISRGWSLERRDRLWAAAALLMGVAAFAGGGALHGLVAVATVVGPWIVFRTFAELRSFGVAPDARGAVAAGLVSGFALVVVVGLLLSVQAADIGTALTAMTVLVWDHAPALFGHSVLVLGALIAMLTREHRYASGLTLGLTALGVVVSGSREAAAAWVVVASILATADAPRSRLQRLLAGALLVLMSLIALGLSPLLGIGRVGFTVADGGEATRNLFAGTELPNGDWWDDRWVEVQSEPVTLDGRELTAYTVRKSGQEPWLRLQQLVRLEPGTSYTLSAWIDTETSGVPSFHGWGQPDDGTDAFMVLGWWRGDRWTAHTIGPGELIEVRELQRDGSWQRVAVSFRYDANARPLSWFVGFVPDNRDGTGEPGRMAGMQLEEGREATPYQPGRAAVGLPFAYARAPLWDAAWHAFLQRPLLGWGPGHFPELLQQRFPGVEQRQFLPRHAHNLALQTLAERGLLGLLGTLLLLVALFGPAFRTRDVGMQAVLAAVLILNTFDATLWSGSILFPLAAAAGWRQAGRAPVRHGGVDNARQATVRATLVLSDVVAAAAAVGVAHAVAWVLGGTTQVGPALPYALLLWPALAWREGLQPGYGLTPAQELAKQMATVGQAGLLFTAATVLFPADLAMPGGMLITFLLATVATLPLFRALTKRLLHAGGLWGRSVVILGAGETGRRIARALQRSPLDGLQPIALFDDDRTLHGRRLEGIRVRGSLDDAYRFSLRHDVHHAIVAIPGLEAERLDRLVATTGRVFRRVRFVPRLGGLPSEQVTATEMDGMLTLEVRNGLYAPANRAAKRVTDLLGSAALVVVLSPLLAAIWLWVRIDSPGGALHASERVGQGGRIFRCIKFRTMHADAEADLQRLLAADPELRAEYDRWHKLENDPRITRAGRILRRTSLDELPQLWNVLRGDMSLVGPRPYLAREVSDMGPAAEVIQQAKPGMTGYWQVSGRNAVTFADRLEMESHYVRNWSIWWDVILLLSTPQALLHKRDDVK